MAYFKINGVDFSNCVNALKINSSATYSAQTNAAGNTVVDYINTKRKIEVGIIPLNSEAMKTLQNAISAFSVSLTFLNPKTNELEENVVCIIPSSDVDYYTIQADKTLFNGFNLKFTEL